ncbi:hypothetical protein F4782DRAFT_534525 [Xylaria castorea]|nr:hypothetical protein F4782DRAFT_534525 [Xylaria castorea]
MIGEKRQDAPVLLAKDCLRPFRVEYSVAECTKHTTQFILVCDPCYVRTKSRFQPIICNNTTGIKGKAPPYDLGFTILASGLPSGRLRFRLEGLDVAAIAAGQRPARTNAMVMWLRCSLLNPGPQQALLEKRWKLSITSDEASRLLAVDEVERVPLALPKPLVSC